MLVLSLEKHRYYGEAANAGGEEAEEDVGGGDEPKRKDINHRVAIVLCSSKLLTCLRPVYPVHPHTACIIG